MRWCWQNTRRRANEKLLTGDKRKSVFRMPNEYACLVDNDDLKHRSRVNHIFCKSLFSSRLKIIVNFFLIHHNHRRLSWNICQALKYNQCQLVRWRYLFRWFSSGRFEWKMKHVKLDFAFLFTSMNLEKFGTSWHKSGLWSKATFFFSISV